MPWKNDHHNIVEILMKFVLKSHKSNSIRSHQRLGTKYFTNFFILGNYT
jgi:hypothetical protein